MKPQKKNFSTSVLKKATAFVLAISLCVSNLAMPVEAKETVNNVSMKETITEQTNSKEVYSEEKAETYMVRTPEDGMAPMKDFDYYYSDLSEGMVIEYYRGNETEVVIPNEIEGEPVKEINNEAFYGNEKIISIEIPANVIDIMDGTFSQCLNLMEIKVDSDNRYYSSENGVLYDKNKTTIMSCPRGKQDYEFLPSVTSIGDYAFSGCSNLTNIEIPSNVVDIGMRAFSECSGLTNVKIAKGLKSIDYYAFEKCSNLISVEIPSSVISIEDYAFWQCYGMTIYCSENTEAHRYANENDLSVWFGEIGTKPENISEESTEDGILIYREIGDGKVRITRYNGDETEVVIPSEINGKRVISIGESIFWNSQTVTNIKIPSSVIEIEEGAFVSCENLVEIEVDENNPNYSSAEGVLYDKNKIKIISCPRGKQEYSFLSSITEIGAYAFGRCKNLTNVEIPSSVTTIGKGAFEKCSGLINVKIAEGLKSIGAYAFWDCSSLMSIEIPSGVIRIDECAFERCSSLSEIEIPVGVTHISYYTFADCSSLKHIELPASIRVIAGFAFGNCNSLVSITIPEKVEYIKEDTFEGCPELTIYGVEGSKAHIYASENGIPFEEKIFAEPENNEFEYETVDAGEIKITGYTGSKTEIEIPSEIAGKIVTEIGAEVFAYNDNLTSVEIPYGVWRIEEGAFSNCRNLVSVKLPDGVTSISREAFLNCSSLTDIEIPSSVSFIGSFAFSECSSLTNITIPSEVLYIQSGTFLGCNSLINLEISKGVEYIDARAFEGCSSLTSIELPSSIRIVKASAFSGCGNLIEIKVDSRNLKYSTENGVLYDKNKIKLIRYPDGKEEYEFLPSVVEIGEEAFSGCTNLTSIKIPESVVEIGEEAFLGCSNLTSIEIPEGVTEIGEGVFWGCTNLASIEIPESVTEIGGRAFLGCSNLTSIKIPEGIMDIEYGTFWGCINLTKVEIPEGVTEIGEYAFAECYNLPNIEIPEEVIKIGEGAFSECEKLENISLPESITNIEYGAFQGCSNLTEVEIPEKVTRLSDFLFAECRNLQNVKIPTNVTHIGEWAFYGCEKLESITLPEGLIAIEDWAFRECNNLTEVEIPEGVTEIGEGAFLDCYNLINIKMPVGIEEIKGFAFLGCKKLVTIKIPSSVINIGETPFSECDSLIEIEVSEDNQYYSSENGVLYDKDKKKLICCPIGKQAYELVPSVIEIGEKAFSGCTNLTSIEIPEGVTKIGAYAFLSCEKLESISLPKGIRKVEQGTFRACSNLREVELAQGVIEIGEDAFVDCGKLESINLPEGITNIRGWAFLRCSNLTKVEIPSSVNYIDEDVFLDCPNVTIYCTDGSAAHQYAIENGIPFILTDASFRVMLSSVVNGTTVSSIANLIGGGVYNKGETVTVTAPEKVGYNFIGWFAKDAAGTTYAVENALSTENTYTFTAAEADLVAVYVPDGKVALTVTDTTNVVIKNTNSDTVLNTSTGVTPGTKITVVYDLQEGEEFLYWKNASGKVVSTDTVYTFTLINNTTLTPVVKTTEADKLLVEYLNEYNQVLSVEVWITEDTLSSVTPSKLGYICKGWALELNATETISADKIWEKSADGYVKLYPVYEKVTEEHTITYKNNSAEAIAQTTTVELGATYTVNAEDVAVEGQKFSHWTIGNEIVSYNTSYTFLVTGNITLTAVFVAEETIVEKQSILEITSQYEIKNGETVEKVAFVASREIAEGYTLLEHGMLYAKDSDITDENGFIEGVEGVNKFTASGTGMKGAFTLNVRLGNATSLKVRAYAIVKNNTTGEVTTIYSGMSTYNKNN